jgi:hypothetical protein
MYIKSLIKTLCIFKDLMIGQVIQSSNPKINVLQTQ